MNGLFHWFRRTLSDPQIVILLALLVGGLAVLLVAGDVLAPLLASVVIAYLLEGPAVVLDRWRVPRWLSAAVLTLLFLGVLLGILLLLVPVLLAQAAEIARQIPPLVAELQNLLLRLPDEFPEFFDRQQVEEFAATLNRDAVGVGQRLLVYSVALLPTVATLVVYLGILPLLVFFFIKDKDAIIAWILSFLPEHRPLANRVWEETSYKLGAYVRGKIYEIVIVSVVSYVLFLGLDLRFAVLLAVVTGLSTLIPYLGAPLAGVPVAMVAFYQWGLGGEFAWVLASYTILQIVDGAFLSPLLLAGVVNLHPSAVFAAVLIFGDIWGFWGVFFAVPLAAVVQVVLDAWPRRKTVASRRPLRPPGPPGAAAAGEGPHAATGETGPPKRSFGRAAP